MALEKRGKNYRVRAAWRRAPQFAITVGPRKAEAQALHLTLQLLYNYGRIDLMQEIYDGRLTLQVAHGYRLDPTHGGSLATVTAADLHRAATARVRPQVIGDQREMGPLVAAFEQWLGAPTTRSRRNRPFDTLTVKKYMHSLTIVRRWLGGGSVPQGDREDAIQLASPVVVDDFRSYRLEDEGCLPVTLNHDMDALRTFWRYGRMRAELQLPLAEFPKDSVNSTRLEYLPPEQLAFLATVAPAQWWDLFSILPETGLRIGEAQALRWADFDARANTIRVRGEHIKTPASARIVPLMPRASEMLRAMRRRAGAVRVSDFIYDDTRRSYWAARSAWNRMLAVANDRLAALGHMGLAPVRMHDMRHTFAIHLVKAGVDLGTLSRLMGHATEAMTLKYAQFKDNGEGRRAIESLDAYQRAVADAPPRPTEG